MTTETTSDNNDNNNNHNNNNIIDEQKNKSSSNNNDNNNLNHSNSNNNNNNQGSNNNGNIDHHSEVNNTTNQINNTNNNPPKNIIYRTKREKRPIDENYYPSSSNSSLTETAEESTDDLSSSLFDGSSSFLDEPVSTDCSSAMQSTLSIVDLGSQSNIDISQGEYTEELFFDNNMFLNVSVITSSVVLFFLRVIMWSSCLTYFIYYAVTKPLYFAAPSFWMLFRSVSIGLWFIYFTLVSQTHFFPLKQPKIRQRICSLTRMIFGIAFPTGLIVSIGYWAMYIWLDHTILTMVIHSALFSICIVEGFLNALQPKWKDLILICLFWMIYGGIGGLIYVTQGYWPGETLNWIDEDIWYIMASVLAGGCILGFIVWKLIVDWVKMPMASKLKFIDMKTFRKKSKATKTTTQDINGGPAVNTSMTRPGAGDATHLDISTSELESCFSDSEIDDTTDTSNSHETSDTNVNRDTQTESIHSTTTETV